MNAPRQRKGESEVDFSARKAKWEAARLERKRAEAEREQFPDEASYRADAMRKASAVWQTEATSTETPGERA